MASEPFEFLALLAVFFLTSIISVVTGSTSLITVPVMLQFGIEPRSAVATNMLALTFMSLGGSLSFWNRNVIDTRRSLILIIITLVSSVLGAFLLVAISSKVLPLMVGILMVAVVLFSSLKSDLGISPSQNCRTTLAMEIAGYAATFLLGIYGGFFSGGYVTLLTAAFVLLFRMTFIQAVSTTKLINVFSSLIATLVFMWNGLVDYRLGLLLGVVMFLGGMIGGHLVLRLNNIWIRRIFVSVVVILALKLLFYDYVFLGFLI